MDPKRYEHPGLFLGKKLLSWWILHLVGGFSPYPSEKCEFVSWDDEIPN